MPELIEKTTPVKNSIASWPWPTSSEKPKAVLRDDEDSNEKPYDRAFDGDMPLTPGVHYGYL